MAFEPATVISGIHARGQRQSGGAGGPIQRLEYDARCQQLGQEHGFACVSGIVDVERNACTPECGQALGNLVAAARPVSAKRGNAQIGKSLHH